MVGHSTGGGEIAHYVGRHGTGRVAKMVLVGAVPPLMLKTDANPEGPPIEVFDGIRKGTADDRSQFYKDLTMPFYGFNRKGAKVNEGLRDSFWLQGMTGRHQGRVRLHPRVLRGRLHRGPEEDRHADAGHPRRRRPDRADRGRRAEDREDRQGRRAQGLSGRRRTGLPRPKPTSSTPTCWPSSGPDQTPAAPTARPFQHGVGRNRYMAVPSPWWPTPHAAFDMRHGAGAGRSGGLFRA